MLFFDRFVFKKLPNITKTICRFQLTNQRICNVGQRKGLVLGIYDIQGEACDRIGKLTGTGEKYNQLTKGRMYEIINRIQKTPKLGEVRILYDLEPEFCAVALVGLGNECLGYDSFEQIDEGKEAIRTAIATGCKALQKLDLTKILVESCGHAESAAEGAALSVWLYQEKKRKEKQINIPVLDLYDDCDWIGWQVGMQKAAAQNIARQLMETPANLMTPTSFAQNAINMLCKYGINVEVKVKSWAETQNMNGFLSVSRGSCEPPVFLEVSYYGSTRDERPIVLIGQGVTYNSGGLCLKSGKEQICMRADMSGAACVLGATRAVAGLQLPLNIRGLIPLCENMPGCAAMKPGDIFRAMNSKSVELSTTDCAGRLVLADALVYAQSFWPRFIIDVGTNTADQSHALGTAATGVYTNSDALWEYMLASSMHTGDRVWRFPLWDHYSETLINNQNVDIRILDNDGPIKTGAGCKVAAYLNEFVPCGDWLHMDSQGVLETNGTEFAYLQAGLAGRPTRTLIEFLAQLVCYRDKKKPKVEETEKRQPMCTIDNV